jgi:NAD(P)-dependent dehydrogenase (short-subunit alcohol dehydrogenase family)
MPTLTRFPLNLALLGLMVYGAMFALVTFVRPEDFDATMKTKFYAPFWIIKAALPQLKPGACIIGHGRRRIETRRTARRP